MALVGTINSSNDFGLKNRIINGAMVIDQRNAGASVTPTTNATYVVDRWMSGLNQSSKFSVQRVTTAPPGFTNSSLITSLSAYSSVAADFLYYAHKIEGLNCGDLGFGTVDAKTVTVSFWVRSSLSGNFSVRLVNSSFNRSYVTTYTINSTNTWEYKTVTIPGDTTGTWSTNTDSGIELTFDLGSGSTYTTSSTNSWQAAANIKASGAVSLLATNGATLNITGVQLEKGSTATSFDYRPYGTELQLCQRYYHYLGGDTPYQSINTCVYYGTGDAVGFFRHPVEMRGIPTIAKTGSWTALGGGGSAGQTVSADQNGPKTTQLGFTGGSSGTSGQGTTLRGNNDSTLRVTFNAEL